MPEKERKMEIAKVKRRWSDMEDSEDEEALEGLVNGYVVNQQKELNVVDEWEEEYDEELVKDGVEDEMDYMKKIDMFEFVSEEESVRRGGKRPTTCRWVMTKKITDEGENVVRCRLVGRDFKPKRGERDREDLFAAMPPLEAKKILFRMSTVGMEKRRLGTKDEEVLMFVDVRKAHLNGVCEEEVFVELPEEFGKGKRFAGLRRWLYGMRKAAQ